MSEDTVYLTVDESRTVRSIWKNSDGDLTAVTISLDVRDPDGNITNPSILNPSTGVYEALIVFDLPGTWYWEWTGATSEGTRKCRGTACVTASWLVAAASS